MLVVEKVRVVEQTARNSARKVCQKIESILGRTGSRKDGLMGY